VPAPSAHRARASKLADSTQPSLEEPQIFVCRAISHPIFVATFQPDWADTLIGPAWTPPAYVTFLALYFQITWPAL
jgi:hypothetical protein